MSRSQMQKLANLKVTSARRHLRKLEIEAYASAVDVFRAQGVLTKEKLEVLQNLGQHLEIPIERHYAELRRALSDGDLNKTAETLIGFDPSSSWYEEARKNAEYIQPFIPKARFTTNAFRAISNYYTNQMLRDLIPSEKNGKSTTEINTEENGTAKEVSEHTYHNKINPLAAKILAEWGTVWEEPSILSRSYLTPIGLEELTDVFPDQNLDFADLENPPLSPSDDVTIDNYYLLPSGSRRGTEPKTLPTKRRRCTSEHKSQTEDTPSYEQRRLNDKNTPSNLSKIMQDYQIIMNLTKKKQKVDHTEPSTDRRRKGKKAEILTQESPAQTSTENKNRNGLIVPCISIERMPLSHPKPRTPSPGKQQKSCTSTTTSVVESPNKPHLKRMKKKLLSQTPEAKVTLLKSPVKQRRRVKLSRVSVVLSPNKPTSSETGIIKSSPIPSQPIEPQPDTHEGTKDDTHDDIIKQTPEPIEETSEPITTSPKIAPCEEDKIQLYDSEKIEYVTPIAINTNNYVITDTQEPCVQGETLLESVLTPERETEQTAEAMVTEQIVTEQLAVRRKKDSNTSLDIPSPDKIRNEMQSLYSPISSLDTPPDLDRATHFELVPESVSLVESTITHPIFSPITSPDESESPDKETQKLAVIRPTECLSLVLQDTSMDVLPQKCSLALSDIVEEVCESISDPISPSLAFTPREEPNPYPSPDAVFTDSSLMLSKALNSFMSQVISEEPTDITQEHDTTTELAELMNTQVLPPVEELDFAQISASLLSPPSQEPPDPSNS